MDPIDSGMQLLSLLWNNPVVHEMGYMFKVGKNIKRLKESADELEITKGELRQRIESAITSTDWAEPTERVGNWLRHVRQVQDKVGRIDVKYTEIKRTRCLGLGLICWSNYRISKKAAKLTREVNGLNTREQKIGIGIVRLAPAIRRMPTMTEPLLPTTETYLRRVCDQLRDEGMGMVGIWGMAGIGKTSLLQRIHNDPYVSGAGFDYVIWAAASQDHHLDKVRDAFQDPGHLHDKLRKDIARRLGLPIHGDDGAMSIYRFLNGKSFLLLLDDIWVPFDLRKLGIPFQGNSNMKRKVVFTTQSETVCKKTMSYHEESDFVSSTRIKMECLEEEEAWELFQRNVGGTVRDIIACDIRVHDYAKEMTRKCGGLPLALIIVAHAMSACETWYEWKAAATSVEMWRSNEVDHLYHPLKLGFRHLPNDNMRRCFLCCALWPSGYYIREEDLINCWMGMDLLGERRDIDVAYLTGYGIIEFLKRASLLEDGGIGLTGKYVRMHDIIREMALLVASDERVHKDIWMVLAGAKLQQASEDDWREAEAISLVDDHAGSLEIFPTDIELKRLTTLILQLNCAVQSFPGYIFKVMPFLTFLDLSKTGVDKIPPEIGQLIYLRYLNLSCYGRYALPMELASLVRLKYFLVSSNGCNLVSIPRGLLSALKKLQLLDLTYSVYEGWEAVGEASMIELDSRVISLGITALSLSPMAFLNGETSSVHLWRFRLCQLEEVRRLMLCNILRRHTEHLFELCISDCDGLGEITITDGRYDNLQYFSLNGFHGLKSIIWNRTLPGVAFQNVRFLELCGNQYLKNVTWISQLSHLEYVSLRELKAMERVIDDEAATEEVTSFRYLKSLILHSLPELRSFSSGRLNFPSLESITIFNCPKLDEASFHASYNTQR